MKMVIEEKDIKEIEGNYERIAKFLIENFCSFNAAAFVLQTIENGVKEAEQLLSKREKEE